MPFKMFTAYPNSFFPNRTIANFNVLLLSSIKTFRKSFSTNKIQGFIVSLLILPHETAIDNLIMVCLRLGKLCEGSRAPTRSRWGRKLVAM